MYHVGKILVADLDPISVSFIRWFIATIFLMVMYYRGNGRSNFLPPAKNVPILMVLGLLGVFIYNLLFFFAEKLISGNVLSIIYSFSPAIAVILSTIFFKTKTNLLTWIGIIVSVIGAIAIINLSNPNCNSFFCSDIIGGISFGKFLAIGLSICMAIYSLVSRKAKTLGISSLAITTYGALWGTFFLLICAIFEGNLYQIFSLNTTFWLAMLYASIGANVLGYKWFNDSVSELGIIKTVIFQNGIPLTAIIVGYLFFEEKISTSICLSSVIIIIGILLTNYSLIKNPD